MNYLAASYEVSGKIHNPAASREVFNLI